MIHINLEAEVALVPGRPETWTVEAIDMENDGDIYVTMFSGPDAKDRALEYATEKYTSVLVVPAPADQQSEDKR